MAVDNTSDSDGGVRDALETAVDTLVPDPQETTVEVQAPETWEQADKDVFGTISDPKARQWLLDRDKNYGTKITEYETRYKGFDELFTPHMDRLKAANQQPVDVIKNLLNAQVALEQNPVEAFKWLAKTYGVDVAKLVAPAVDGEKKETKTDPLADLDPQFRDFLTGIKSTVDTIKLGYESEQQRQQREVTESLNRTTTEFREAKDDKGALLHPHMTNKAVTDHMAMLIRTGVVQIVGGDVKAAYKQAYDQAIYAVPTVWDQVLKAREEARKAEEGKVSRERLLAAKKAGAGIRGVGASESSRPTKGSVRDQLAGQFKEAGLL